MEKQTIGNTIAQLRKEKNMTQAELAQKMGVTDKAVSKWERDLSLPDTSSLPKLAQILGISVDALMQAQLNKQEQPTGRKAEEIVHLALQGVALAMGVAVAVLSFMGQIQADSAIGMLGIGLACLAIAQLSQKSEK